MKIGDKIYCKKDITGYGNEKPSFMKGKYYTVMELYNDSLVVTSEQDINYRVILDNHKYANASIYHDFSKYFMSEKEMRTKKLIKLKLIQ